MLNTHCVRRKATLHLSPAIAAKAESLVTDIVTDALTRFPIIAQRSKGTHYFHRVVGLEVINICQWSHLVNTAAVSVKLRSTERSRGGTVVRCQFIPDDSI